MSFLAPLFFAALAALGAPILFHMIQRQRTEVIEFPSLMFVRKIPFHSLRRQRIKHWVLLLLRCAALALLIAAFSRPFFSSNALAAVTGGAREVVVLVDRSYSMGYGTRWERARDAARRVLGNLLPDDRATIVFFDSGAQSGARSTTDRASLLAAVDAAELSAGTTRYGPALQLAQGIFEDSDLPTTPGVSDHRLSADRCRQRGERACCRRGPCSRAVSVADEDRDRPTFCVAGASVAAGLILLARERAAVTARLANRGNETVEEPAGVARARTVARSNRCR